MAEFHNTLMGQRFYASVERSLDRIAAAEENKVDSLKELNTKIDILNESIKNMNGTIDEVKNSLDDIKSHIDYLR